jgi:predicted nucleic acid-binding protein
VRLIDSSSWIHYLRGSDTDIADRVEALLSTGEAGWCEMVAAELWCGVRNDGERRKVQLLERAVTNFPITPEVWTKSYLLGAKCRENGVTVPVQDIVIIATAFHYLVETETSDSHFELVSVVARKLFSKK